MQQTVSRFAFVVPHTHWDREWYLPFEAFRMRLVKAIDSLCDFLEKDPLDSFHLDGQAIVVEDYEEIRGRSERLRRLVKEGKIQIGPWYVQPDEFLTSGEALIRNIQLGFKISSEIGKPTMVGYLPDMFGHTGQMPQIFQGFGIRHAVVWRGVPPNVTKCGFRWIAPDSTEVFAAFLPLGYMNGFNLPSDPNQVRGRLAIGPVIMGRFLEGPSFLVMAGTDHQQPRPGLPALMKKAVEGLDGWDAKVTTLMDYLEHLESESKERPVVTGEMRIPHYAPVIPATASARLYLKKRDFVISSMLERYAEPIATWVWALGGADRNGFLKYAWKVLLQNHPHDSICGCSTDEVHREVDVRYSRAETVVGRILFDAGAELGRMMNLPRGNWLAMWSTTSDKTPMPVIAEIEGKIPKNAELESPDGKRIPLQALEKIDPGEIIGAAEVPGIGASLGLAFLFQEEEMLAGYFNDVDFKMEGNVMKIAVSVGATPSGVDMAEARKKLEEAIARFNPATLKVEVRKNPRIKAVAVLDNVSPFSISAFKLSRSKEPPKSELKRGDNVIENSCWRIAAQDNGTLTIHDRKNDIIFKNALRYADEGDRGDAYTFEPTPECPIIEGPIRVRIRKLYDGPAAAGLSIESLYKIPSGLDSTKKARSKQTVPLKITTDVTIYNDVRRIDFRSTVINNACDHRLRVLFEAPFRTDEFLCETAFEVARRKANVAATPRKPIPGDIISLLIGPEAEVGFGPHRGFAALENGSIGMALINRGLPEIEAVKGDEGAALALTLIRSVGTISRDDLTLRSGHAGPPIPTPDMQCLGKHVCEFAFTSYKGSWQTANLPVIAHSYRHPPYVFRVAGGGNMVKSGDYPISVDNPAIEIRALQPAPDGSAAVCARIYNTTDRPQKARLQLHSCFKKYSEADLMGKAVEDKHVKKTGDHTLVIELPPARIVTLRLEM